MEVDTEDCSEIAVAAVVSPKCSVANDPSGRHHDRRTVLPPGGHDVKLAQRGPYESAACASSGAGAGTRTSDIPEGDKDKGRKRRKYRRVRPNKKWLWRKELAEAAGIRDSGATGMVSPTLLGRMRMSASVTAMALPAPNNTTQFIMEDHTELQGLGLDLEPPRGSKTTRARDSSFSIDSDEDLSSSPDDEAYLKSLSKEFSNTYEDVHIERLGTMTKLDLIQEYLQLEQRIDTLEKRLKTAKKSSSGTGDGGTGTDSDSEAGEGEMPMEPAMAEKIRIFQEEIQKLVVENQQLLQDNSKEPSSCSLARRSSSSVASSVDSESDSSTSSGSSTTSSSAQSKASVSSRSSKSSGRTQDRRREVTSDVEMTPEQDCEKTPTFSAEDQGVQPEIGSEALLPKSPHEDSSLVSSVAAH